MLLYDQVLSLSLYMCGCLVHSRRQTITFEHANDVMSLILICLEPFYDPMGCVYVWRYVRRSIFISKSTALATMKYEHSSSCKQCHFIRPRRMRKLSLFCTFFPFYWTTTVCGVLCCVVHDLMKNYRFRQCVIRTNVVEFDIICPKMPGKTSFVLAAHNSSYWIDGRSLSLCAEQIVVTNNCTRFEGMRVGPIGKDRMETKMKIKNCFAFASCLTWNCSGIFMFHYNQSVSVVKLHQ